VGYVLGVEIPPGNLPFVGFPDGSRKEHGFRGTFYHQAWGGGVARIWVREAETLILASDKPPTPHPRARTDFRTDPREKTEVSPSSEPPVSRGVIHTVNRGLENHMFIGEPAGPRDQEIPKRGVIDRGLAGKGI